jgi:hypothetical protein
MAYLSRHPSLVLLAVAACHAGSVAAIEVPPVEGPPSTLKAGEERHTKWLRNGRELVQISRLLDETTIERRESDGCITTRSNKDIYSPNLTWKNCNPGPWGSGNAEDMQIEGALWPLKVGNKVQYRFKTVNSMGQTNLSAYRTCEVTGTALAQAGGQEYPSYKTVCKDHNSTRTLYYAPSVARNVRTEQKMDRGGSTLFEFVEVLPAAAPSP